MGGGGGILREEGVAEFSVSDPPPSVRGSPSPASCHEDPGGGKGGRGRGRGGIPLLFLEPPLPPGGFIRQPIVASLCQTWQGDPAWKFWSYSLEYFDRIHWNILVVFAGIVW